MLRRCWHNREGAAIIEFALIAPLFFFLMFCILELGLLTFSQIALESATMQVSRSAAIGTSGQGCDRACTVRRLIEEKTRGLIDGENVVVEANTLANGGVQRAPEFCLTEPPTVAPPSGTCPNGVGCLDTNNNGRCDGPGSVSLGAAGDLVEIRVSYPWQLKIPFLDTISFSANTPRTGRLYGREGVVLLSASTVIKNEPFTNP